MFSKRFDFIIGKIRKGYTYIWSYIRASNKQRKSESIKNRRIELGLTLEEVAAKVGVTKATVQRWESGLIANLRRDKISTLAKALETSPAFILGFDCANFGTNNGIIGDNNHNNHITNAKALTPIQNAIIAVCSTLTEEQQSDVLSYATKLLNKKDGV